jgi:hypothetical protein
MPRLLTTVTHTTMHVSIFFVAFCVTVSALLLEPQNAWLQPWSMTRPNRLPWPNRMILGPGKRGDVEQDYWKDDVSSYF